MQSVLCDLCHTEAEPLLQLTTDVKTDTGNPEVKYNTYEVWCQCSRCHVLLHTVEPDEEIRMIIGTVPLLPGLDIIRSTEDGMKRFS